MINLAFGSLLGLGLFFIGVPYFFLWGSLAAVLRFIPYVGSWVAAGFPLVLSFAISPSLTQPISVLILFLVLDIVTGNVVEPVLFGRGAGVSPVALLIAAAFWTWIWGIVGLVLSTPLTVCLVVLGQHVPRLRFLQLLLGAQPALPEYAGFYQRLLARDAEEARQTVVEYVAAGKGGNVYDALILPALAMAQRDRKTGALSGEDERFIVETTGAVLGSLDNNLALPPEEIGTQPAGGNGTDRTTKSVLVFGCPARNAIEELTLSMLARFLLPNCRFEIVPSAATDLEDRVDRDKPAILVIAVLPPGGLVQAVYMCKRLRRRYPRLGIVVGYWGGERNYENILVRLRSAGASYVTTSLSQTANQVHALAGITVPLPPVEAPAIRGNALSLEPTLGKEQALAKR
jgi:hypothetical protein